MSTTTARPRQTTMAGAMVMLGGVFVVLSAWDRVARLRSVESRESIEKSVTDILGADAGISLESMIQAWHVTAIVAALCAVAAVALGWQVLQRSSGARLALSVVAVPLFITGLAVSGFTSALVVVATAMLWLTPSRQWLAGESIPEPVKRPQEGMQVWEQTTNQVPEPTPESSVTPSGWSVSAGASEKRPGAVTVALVLTLVMAGVVLVMTLLGLVLLIAQPEVLLEELRRQDPDNYSGISDARIRTASYASCALLILWSALAIVLALLTAGRRAWAARGLMICSAVCAVFCVVATVTNPATLVPALAALVTVSCLRRPDARAWFADRPGPSAE